MKSYYMTRHGVVYTFPTPDARPVVVIDPEDREQCDRLCDALYGGHAECVGNLVQDALRSLIEPPKPEEPTGLGAVVEDADGERWVRGGDGDDSQPWTDGLTWFDWSRVSAVKVLSEGVQP